MKKKQKLQKFLNSFFKSHGDIEEDKKEIENDVKKMLELFENNSEDISDRSDFVSLVNDIKKRYHALYGRYDGLISKMKNKVHHRKAESRSGSSDSESEDSSDEDGSNEIQEQKIVKQLSLEENQSFNIQLDSLSKRNAELETQTSLMQTMLEESQHLAGELIERGTSIVKLEDELQTVRNSLKLLDAENKFLKTEMEKSKEQEGKLSLQVSGLREENEVLMSEKEKVSSMLHQADSSVMELKSELEKRMEDARKLREDNSFLKEDLERKAQEVVNLNQQIMLISEERETLRVVVTELESGNDSLMSENERILIENKNLKAQMEAAIQQVSNKEDKLVMLEGENDVLKSQILKSSTHMHEADETMKDMTIESGLLKEDILKLHDTIIDLNHQLKVKEDENYAMTLESSESRKLIKQAEERIMILSVEAERLKSENPMLLTGLENLKLELEGTNQELSKHKQSLQATESKMISLREENTILLGCNDNLKLEQEFNKQELSKVQQALERTEYERTSLIEEKTALLKKINEGWNIIDGLKTQIEEVESEKSQLQRKINNLDLEIQSANLQIIDVKNALAATEEEKNALVSENVVVESKIQEAEFTKERLQSEVEKLNQKNSILLSKIEDSKNDTLIESRLLKEEISKLHDTITDLNHQMKVKDEENYAWALASTESSRMMEQAEERLMILSVEAEKMKSENSMLLTERENLRFVLEDNKQALEVLEFEINSLKAENSLLLSGHENLKLELEGNNQELSKLKQALEATEFERNSLIDENSSLLTKVNEGGMAIDGLKAQIEEVESEKCHLQQKISDLDLKIQSNNLQFTDVTNALVAAEEEKKALVSENSVLGSRLHEANFMKERLQTEMEELIQKNSILLSKIEEAEKATTDLMFERDGLIADNAQLEIKVNDFITELEAANSRLSHLEKLVSFAGDEKRKFASEISIQTGKLQLAEADNEKLGKERDLLREENTAFQKKQERLQNKMVDHYKNLEVTLSEMQDLKDKLELDQKEVLHEVRTWTDTFKRDILEMVTEKCALDQELRNLADISSENEASLKNLEDILRSKISDHETHLKSHEELLTKHKQLEDSYYESCAKLDTAEKKFEQIEMKEEIIQRLERICAEQKNDISKLGENCRELLEKLSSTEVGKVDAEKEIQRLEVQLRLSNQKLKITETEYKEKEENCKRLVAGLQEDLKLLDRYVLTWSRNFIELNNEFKQIKVVLESGMGTLVDELEEVESVSLENLVHIKEQLAECLVELHSLKTWLKSELHEKKKLKNENHELAVGLAYKEGIILKLKDESSRNLAHLAGKEKELRILESRVAESEKNLKEKERVVLDKDEEKREAIRQLCLVIEYHWENRNYLVRHLSSVLGSRGTS